MAPKERQAIDLNTLDPRELAGLRQDLEASVENLTRSAIVLQKTAAEFGKAGQAIEVLKEQKEGQPMLVPLTSSLYAEGTITQPDKVLVDIGTGYYLQTSADKGVSYCKRKINYLKEQILLVSKELKTKQEIQQKVTQVLQQKTQAQQQK